MKRAILFFCATFLFAATGFSQSWVTQTTGVTNTIREVFFIDANTGWAVGADGAIIKTTNGGSIWQSQTIVGGGLMIGCYFVNEMTGWVGGDMGVYKTTNGGYGWSRQSGPVGVTKLFFLNALQGWAVGGRDGSTPYYGVIYKTTDGGTTWTETTDNIVWTRFYGVQFADANTGWCYTEKKGLLVKTEDGGTTWKTQIAAGDTLMIKGMYFLDKNTGWVTGRTATAGIVLKTTDGGTTWKNVAGSLAYSVSSPRFINATFGWAAGADRYGHPAALRTMDGGATWTPYEVPGSPALEGATFLNGTSGWAYGGSGTVIKFDIPTAVVEHETAAPKKFALEQNYPNPFNPSTRISFTIPATGYTTLKVYDVLGNEAATLISREMTAGSYATTFNASHLTSGVYFYRLQNGAFSETKKLVLTK